MKPWLPLLALSLALAPLAVVHPVRVQGRSMEPTLRDGRMVWILRAWAAGAPREGQVWMVEAPGGPALKRVLGLPGDRLDLHNGELFRQGRRLEEPYLTVLDRAEGTWEAGTGYLLLGDNRPESRDSRAWGPRPRSAFQGRVLGLD